LLPAAAAAGQTPCQAVKIPLPSGLLWRERAVELRRLARWHRHKDSVVWRLTDRGVSLCSGRLPVSRTARYRMRWVPQVWRRYGPLIAEAAHKHNLPAELIVTIIVNESGGRGNAINTYRGYVSDARTPNRISIGVGQMLLSTARAIMNDRSINRAWLLNPRNAIGAIAVYLDRQYQMTGFDPPLVAAAYNAGALYRDASKANRWRLRNHPVGRSIYIDNFVAIANAAAVHLRRPGKPPNQSFAALLMRTTVRPTRRPDCGKRCGE
jgi:hypothetical protein